MIDPPKPGRHADPRLDPEAIVRPFGRSLEPREDLCDAASAIESLLLADEDDAPFGRLAFALALLAAPSFAFAGKLSWLDDVVQEVILEARVGGKSALNEGGTATKTATRLFSREADEGLETLARRSDAIARGARLSENPSEALLKARFNRLLRPDPETARVFGSLALAEKRVVVEMGEAAQQLARRYPGQAEMMVRKLGTEGLAAVRVYGDDVAEVVVKEGPDVLGVLRKTGRGGWKFLTETVLPNKKKLIAAGLLAAFLADPDKFVDTAGRATEYAVQQFGKAGVDLLGSVSKGAARGLETSVGDTLAAYGLNVGVLRYLGMGLAGLVILGATFVLLGLPLRWMLRPITWPLGLIFGRGRRANGLSQ